MPLKFNLYAGRIEKASVSDIKTFYHGLVGCGAGFECSVDIALLSTGGTSLRYSGNRDIRTYIQIMQVDRSPASSTFGFYVGGQNGPTVSVATSLLF